MNRLTGTVVGISLMRVLFRPMRMAGSWMCLGGNFKGSNSMLESLSKIWKRLWKRKTLE